MQFLDFLILSLLLLICFHGFLHLANWISLRRKLPPGPIGLPIIGSLLQLGDRPHESLTKLAHTHGPLMTIRLGFVTTVVASSADMAKEILQKNDQAFLGRHIPDAATAENDYDESITWLSGGPRWRNLRKLLNTQMFTTQKLDQLQGLRHQMMEDMVRRVTEAVEAGEILNIGRLVFGTILNLLSNTIFSVDMIDSKSSMAEEELKNLVSRIMELAGKPNLADYFPFLKPFDPQHIRRDIKVCYDRLHSIVDDIIDHRLQRRAPASPRSHDFLDVLLDHSQARGSDFSRRDTKLLLTALFIGGTDTTTTTLEWAMAELLRNPCSMVKAKQELVQTIGKGRSVEESDIPRLPYLQAVVKEVMRLHPTVPFLLPHRAETDVQVGAYTVRKNTQVLVNAWAIGRDETYWENPACFMPERFLGSEVDFRGQHLCFIPFGAGRRMCPGQPLAVRMVSMLLAALVHHFDWRLPGGMGPEQIDMRDKFGITLHKAIPLLASPSAAAF